MALGPVILRCGVLKSLMVRRLAELARDEAVGVIFT